MVGDKYRYWLDQSGATHGFIDTPAKRKEIEEQAVGYSVHAFSGPLWDAACNVRVWGDLLLTWNAEYEFGDVRDFSNVRRKLRSFLELYAIPEEQLKYFYTAREAGVVIPERLFRGELGISNRLEAESALRKELGCISVKPPFVRVGKILLPFTFIEKLPWSNAEYRHVPTDAAHFWQDDVVVLSDIPIPTSDPLPCVCVSPLAARFVPDGYARYDFLHFCPVVHKGINLLEIMSDREVSLLVKILGTSKAMFKWIASKGNEYLRNCNAILHRLDGAASKSSMPRGPMLCKDIAEELGNMGSELVCRHDCGVTTPHGLAFSEPPYAEAMHGLAVPDVAGSWVTAAGVFDKASSKSRKDGLLLPRPVWISGVARGHMPTLQGRKISFFDMAGAHKEIVVDSDGMQEGTLFKQLQNYGLHIAQSRKVRSAARKYLHSGKSKNLFLLADGNGWLTSQGRDSFVMSECSRLKEHGTVVIPTKRFSYEEPIAGNVESPYSSYGGAASGYALLVVAASLAAPLLKLLKARGICLHFFASEMAGPQALLRVAESVWRTAIGPACYKLPVLAESIPEIKRFHRDTVLCLDSCHPDGAKELLKAVRRYFYGRKGGEEGCNGVVLAAGQEAVGAILDQPVCYEVVKHKQDVLVVSISYRHFSQESLSLFGDGLGERFIHELTGNLALNLLGIFADVTRFETLLTQGVKGPVPRQVASFFAICASVLSFSYKSGLITLWNGVEPAESLVRFCQVLQSPPIFFWDYLRKLDVMTERAFPVSRWKSRTNLLLFPPALFHRCSDPSYAKPFQNWLISNKVMLRGSKTEPTSVCHVAANNRSQRGFLICPKALKIFLGYAPVGGKC